MTEKQKQTDPFLLSLNYYMIIHSECELFPSKQLDFTKTGFSLVLLITTRSRLLFEVNADQNCSIWREEDLTHNKNKPYYWKSRYFTNGHYRREISKLHTLLTTVQINKKYCLRESISCRSEFEDLPVVFIVCTLLSIIFYYHWKPLPSFPIAEYCYDVPRIKNNTKVFHVGKDACNTMNQTSFEIQYFFWFTFYTSGEQQLQICKFLCIEHFAEFEGDSHRR